MSSKSLGYEEAFIIRTYEIDNQKKATIQALIRLMQEAAMQNVMKLKLSVWDMQPHHISWVLLRKDLRINRLPSLGEKILVKTIPTGFEKYFSFRDFRIFDQQQQLLAYSSSSWLLMNTLTRKMARIPEFILQFGSKMPPSDTYLPRPECRFPSFEQVDIEENFRVNWHHLDFNQHLNNTQYIAWMLDAMPKEYLQNGTLKRLEIQYRHECKYQDMLWAQTQQIGDKTFIHRLINQENQQEVAFAKTLWE
ncbi:MAG: acyl-ACP thioesterase [Saprospiraceae bacterium]|nr:MAG: acyl-ACP thioesterase [Saprospiraceae bacterium]